MKENRYRLTVERVTGNEMLDTVSGALQFDVTSHDDIFSIVERMRQRNEFLEDEAAALAVGLKLFSGVMMANRTHNLFASFEPYFREFMKQMKRGPGSFES